MPQVEALRGSSVRVFLRTSRGRVLLGDSTRLLADLEDHSVDLIVTSPPFGLVRKKSYGNVDAAEYLDWFRPFADGFKRVLRPNGSLVVDIGGAWVEGLPTRSLYHFKLLVMLCEDFGFHLAQEFYWWNPSKLPTPAEWVTVRRIRVKDAVNCIWWLSVSPWPRADNRRVLQPYSESMRDLLKNGYKAKLRPSGHQISEQFNRDNGAAIPPNLFALANTESNSRYLRYCKTHSLEPHPARFPSPVPEFFIRMLSDPGDLVLDPFAGSCVTGEVAERLNRRWLCCELVESYLKGAVGRFTGAPPKQEQMFGPADLNRDDAYYKAFRPGLLWTDVEEDPLPSDGGRRRSSKPKHEG